MSILDQLFPPNLSTAYDETLANQLANTQGAIASLNQMTRQLHNPLLLMNPILYKEAESSAQLEGTQASLDDAYQIDITNQTTEMRNEALEIRNYREAMLLGMNILNTTGKLNNLTIRSIHKQLMRNVRGNKKHPGEFRKGDVWIGDLGTEKGKARYIAPDAMHIQELTSGLIKFIEERGRTNPLIKCAIIHYRFEAIHPFEDGNGRTGRLLISLYLIKENMLSLPVLYPSGYFEKNKSKYIDCLSSVDKKQNWYDWLLHFLKALEVQAKVSLKIGSQIDELFKQSKSIIEKEKANLNIIRLLEFIFTQPYITTPIVQKELDIPSSTGARYLELLKKKRIVEEYGIHKKQKVYINNKLLTILRNV